MSKFAGAAWFPLLAVAALLMALTVPAAAQTAPSVFVNQTLLIRKQLLRAAGQRPRWINRADCLADDVLTFQTTVSPLNNSAFTFEVWAGPSSADCTKPESRGVATNTCWLVYRAVPTIRTYDVNIRAQDIAAQNYPSQLSAPGTAADCESGGASGALALTFMFVELDQVVGTTATWNQTGVDVTPPWAPTDVTVEPGENRLLVEWTTSTPSDLLEWRFYCDSGEEASTSGDSCLGVPTVLVPGEVPPEAYRCGTATGDATRDGHAEGLVNGVTYAVGVVGVDEVANVGKLSEVPCGTPELQPDSSEQGGGGFCSISRGEGPAPAVGLGALSLVCLGLLRRRKGHDCGESPC